MTVISLGHSLHSTGSSITRAVFLVSHCVTVSSAFSNKVHHWHCVTGIRVQCVVMGEITELITMPTFFHSNDGLCCVSNYITECLTCWLCMRLILLNNIPNNRLKITRNCLFDYYIYISPSYLWLQFNNYVYICYVYRIYIYIKEFSYTDTIMTSFRML